LPRFGVCDVPGPPSEAHSAMCRPEAQPALPALSLVRLSVIMALLIFLGSINFVLVKEMYAAYGDRYAFFANQGVNALYLFYGALVVVPRMMFTKAITPEMRRSGQRRYIVMGILDALGTFFTAMGAVYTPGSMQPLLNQMLIPFTMVFSICFLDKIFGRYEASGALLIAAGACMSAIPPLLAEHDYSKLRWYSVLVYLLSNMPMAASSCYKQKNFRDREVDVWYLTQWVSWWQFLLSFALIPLLCLPGMSSPHGTPLVDVPAQLIGGWECYMERDPVCRERHCFWLLNGYCAVNVLYNTLGLYLTKVGSAVMNAVSYALLLPVTTLLFFTPFVGPVQESFTKTSWFTLAGLVVVVVGFSVYQHYARGVGFSDEETVEEPAVKGSDQAAFQERVIGMGTGPVFGSDRVPARTRTRSGDGMLSKPLLGGQAAV